MFVTMAWKQSWIGEFCRWLLVLRQVVLACILVWNCVLCWCCGFQPEHILEEVLGLFGVALLLLFSLRIDTVSLKFCVRGEAVADVVGRCAGSLFCAPSDDGLSSVVNSSWLWYSPSEIIFAPSGVIVSVRDYSGPICNFSAISSSSSSMLQWWYWKRSGQLLGGVELFVCGTIVNKSSNTTWYCGEYKPVCLLKTTGTVWACHGLCPKYIACLALGSHLGLCCPCCNLGSNTNTGHRKVWKSSSQSNRDFQRDVGTLREQWLSLVVPSWLHRKQNLCLLSCVS